MVSCRIDNVHITPNPVGTNSQILISVSVTNIIQGIQESGGAYIETADGLAIEAEIPQGKVALDADGQPVLTGGNEAIEFS